MNETSHAPKPKGESPLAEPIRPPTPAPPGGAATTASLRDRLRAIQKLAAAGDEAAQLREFRAAVASDPQLQLQVLRVLQQLQGPTERSYLSWQRGEHVKHLLAASCRKDLTIPEAQLLYDLVRQAEASGQEHRLVKRR
jgi:hypothetical protein